MNISIGGFLTFLVLFIFGTGIVIAFQFQSSRPFSQSTTHDSRPAQFQASTLLNKQEELETTRQQLDASSERITELDAEIVEYSDRLEQAKGTIYTLKTKLEEKEESILLLNQEITRLTNLLEQTEEEKETLKADIVSLERQLADLYNDYAELYQQHQKMKATIVRLLRAAVPLLVVGFGGIGYLFFRQRQRSLFV